jgi:hypothetical protein
VQIAMSKGLAAAGVNIAIALLRGADFPAAGAIGAAAIVSFFGVGVSLVFFVLALRHLGTARTGAYFRWPLSSAPWSPSGFSMSR